MSKAIKPLGGEDSFIPVREMRRRHQSETDKVNQGEIGEF